MTKARLVANESDNVDLILEPVKGPVLIDEASIHKLIADSEFTTLFVNMANIRNALAELKSVLKPLQDGKTGREISYQILDRIDAKITISIDSDEMSATAEITAAMGGKNLTAKAILDAAKEVGVKKGFSKESLLKLAHVAAQAEPSSMVKRKIAIGKEAVRGKDARIKHLVESAQDRILRPKEREDGSVDMRDLGDIICVKVGEPLAQKLPLTKGEKGYTVTATPLIPEPGEDTSLIAGDGTTISPKNENVLISTLVGQPKIIDNGMAVDETYQINEVNVSTGHIDFQGSVIIKGDVSEGMKVIATGDITIGGFVESATLEAGGDITISTGIIGKKQDVEDSDITEFQMSSQIRAKGKIYAKYGQYAEIISGGDIRIENQLMHSLVEVGGNLWVGSEDSANGKLIGGYIKATNNVQAGFIGATAGSKTIIEFQHRVEEFKAKLAEIDGKIQVENEKVTELQAARKKLKSLPKENQNKAILTKVVTTYQYHASRMGDMVSEREKLEQEMQEYMMSVYVEATNTLYQHVELIVGEFSDRTKREYPPSRMKYRERKIHIDPIV
ncbi:DUF342 domain-containing protein [Thalassotalea atypica]|uniref:DUF342 domain-containing protein n=1 Tax=Thalassotalea atypica TaxID=2054316 RepID=UPI002572F651|nr:FapA family protein [Thalassotalea atypica]